MIVANRFRQDDEDAYRMAHPAPRHVHEPDSILDAALFVIVAIGFLVLIAWSSGGLDW